MTENAATRPYYIALIMTILAPSNGDSEVYFWGRKFSRFPLVDSLGKLTRRQPKWFLTHVMHGPYSELYADWIKTVPILEEEFRQVETFIAYIREQVLSPEEVPAFEKDLFQLRWDLIERYKGRY